MSKKILTGANRFIPKIKQSEIDKDQIEEAKRMSQNENNHTKKQTQRFSIDNQDQLIDDNTFKSKFMKYHDPVESSKKEALNRLIQEVTSFLSSLPDSDFLIKKSNGSLTFTVH